MRLKKHEVEINNAECVTAPAAWTHSAGEDDETRSGVSAAPVQLTAKMREEIIAAIDLTRVQSAGQPALDVAAFAAKVRAIATVRTAALWLKSSQGLPPTAPVAPMHIVLRNDVSVEPAQTSRPFDHSAADKAVLREWAADMQAAGKLVRAAPGPTSGRAFVVTDSDGKGRVVSTHPQLNDALIVGDAVMVGVEAIQAAVAASDVHFAATIDLASAFFQLPVDRRSQPLLRVRVDDAIYMYTVAAMGVASSPIHLQNLLNNTLADCVGTFAHVDDVVVVASTAGQLLERVDAVLAALQRVGLRAASNKIVISNTKIPILGNVVDLQEHHIEPNNDGVEQLRNLAQPETVTQLRLALSLAAHVSRFNPLVTAAAAPLRALIPPRAPKGSKRKVQWTEGTERAWERLLGVLAEKAVLVAQDPARPVAILSDASKVGAAAM